MVLNGIDRISCCKNIFQNKRLGLLTSISGVDKNLESTIKIINETCNLTTLYGPEHGVRGDRDAGELVDQYIDDTTGLQVFSLYQKDSKRFTAAMLEDIDAIVYDIQDVGCRFYTFISTMIYALEDCAKFNKELILLDRFNILGGKIEGGVLQKEYFSFVGPYSLPVRYGLTIGELATLVNTENKISCNLNVIACEGWNRDMMFPDTGNIWMMPSIGIPTFETALSYAGNCIFEGTNLSEGRGTTAPFSIIGAPFIDANRLSDSMNSKQLDGVLFTACYFKPTFSKHSGIFCKGVYLHITDFKKFQPIKTGAILLDTIRHLYPNDFEFLPPHKEGSRRFIELLSGDSFTNPNSNLTQLLNRFDKESNDFKEIAKKYYLYT